MSLPLDLLMFAALAALIVIGAPIVFVLSGTAVAFALLGLAFGHFDTALLGAIVQRVFSVMVSETLVAIPLFLFMGMMLERSKIAEELLEAMGRLFGTVRGGLAVSVSLVGALLAASTGIVGATTVTMGMMALPAMLRRGYSPALACGSVCAAGTLGQIIPPSTVMVVMGEVLSSAYQQAQFAQGKFSVETVSVGQLFAGSLLPGLLLVVMYIVYQLTLAWWRPASAPAIPRDDDDGHRVTGAELLRALVPPLVLIGSVLGSILGGIATPTEAASIGALGALLLASLRVTPEHARTVAFSVACMVVLLTLAAIFDLRPGRQAPGTADRIALGVALAVSVALVVSLVIGASLFSLVFRGLGGEVRIESLLEAVPGGTTGALVAVVLAIFILGMWLDYVEISIIVIPIVGPVLMRGGVDPVWFGVIVAMTMQTSFLTPPVGYTLSYLRSVAPPSLPTKTIWIGAVPFIVLQLVAVAVLAVFPGLATWLPSVLFSN